MKWDARRKNREITATTAPSLLDGNATVGVTRTLQPPVFTGTLSIEATGAARPALILSFACPACRGRFHDHSWDLLPDGQQDWTPRGREPHCAHDRLRPCGYLVVPADTASNRRVYTRYATLLERAARRARATPPGRAAARG